MKITVHTLVKNEERFVWYSVMSVIEYVDKILLWDTGSSDKTIEILREIKKRYPEKVELNFLKSITVDEFPGVRQQMLDVTDSSWFLVVDGDEIWWEDSIKKVVGEIKKCGDSLESIVVPTINLVGDMFHYQEGRAGQYRLAGRKGHYSLRGVNRRIFGLASSGKHGVWGWVDGGGKMIQDRDSTKIKFIDAPYLHATFLQRSGVQDKNVPKRAMKRKHEIGDGLPLDYYYPEVFFKSRPDVVGSPFEVTNFKWRVRALIETPLRKMKRRVLLSKVGY